MVIVVTLAACGASTERDELGTQEALTVADLVNAFSAVDEPLEIRLDLTKLYPDASLDYVLGTIEQTEESTVEISVFGTEGGAIEYVEILEARKRDGIEPETTVTRKENVVMTVSDDTAPERRLKLIRALQHA